MVYLDWAATAPPDREIHRQALEAALASFGNPSSLHTEGRRAAACLEECRDRLSRALDCRREEIVFTSGGTESNNLILSSLLNQVQPGHGSPPGLVLSAIEHASVYDPANNLRKWGVRVRFVKPGVDGVVRPEDIAKVLDEETRMVSVQTVNNETGAIQPISEIAEAVKSYGRRTDRKILVHTDAVQALGKIPFCPREMGVDAASLSSHKLGGPRGGGALFLARGIPFVSLYRGGEQESGRRPGTENIAGLFGLALAAEKAVSRMEEAFGRTTAMMAVLMTKLGSIPAARILPEAREGNGSLYSPYILKVSFAPIPGEVVVRVLADRGLCVSTGSACSSKRKDKTRVLRAMGVSERLASSSIRISLGAATQEKEIDLLIDALQQEIPPLLRVSLRKSG
jgi:cysteine desulfurase